MEEQIDRIFHLAFTRQPDEEEKARLLSYAREMEDYHAENKPPEVTYPTKITRSLVEEFSGKPFEYEEILPAFEDYTPDKKAADVAPSTRALADVCLLVMNSNEFVYVY